MRLVHLLAFLALYVARAASQNAAFPLESVTIEGSAIPQPVILEIAGLRLAKPIDKEGIEVSCRKLQESGFFSSIAYRFAPGPKKGYAVTLTLADQTPLVDAAIDVPGADEDAAWRWLSARYRLFNRRVPPVEAAQKFLAGEIEKHLGARLRGQRLTVRMETDFKTRKVVLSFQPETLPRLEAVAFAGNQAIASSELAAVVNKVAANAEYTERRFAEMVELNLRPLYETQGLYRVRFTPSALQWSDAGVSLTLGIAEGVPYNLGKVEIAGDSLPVDAMLSAARFPTGKLANGKRIQEGIWEMEKVVRRTGYLRAAALPKRSFDDERRVLDLRIEVRKGPLYLLGEVRFSGLSASQEERARRLWKARPGDAYDYAYADEFFEAFARAVDLRAFRRTRAQPQKGAGEYVLDLNLVFEPR